MKFNQKGFFASCLVGLVCSVSLPTLSRAATLIDVFPASNLENLLIAQGANSKPNQSVDDSQLEKLINRDVTGEMVAPSDAELKVASKSKGQKALKRALTQIGYAEQGENCNKFSRYFHKSCQVWCADFVSWAFDLNGNKKQPWGNVSAVSSILDWGRRTHNTVNSPRVGDIFILKGDGNSHTGIVRSVNTKKGTFSTVEGNADDKVRSLIRPIRTSYTFFVRVPSHR
jgi:CHAP domain